MGKKAFTVQMYEALLGAFREEPGNYAHAARRAGCTPLTAKKAWLHGWENKAFARPIRVVLEEQKEKLRASRAQAQEKLIQDEIELRVKAREDAIKAKLEEATGSQHSRKNALNFAIVTSKMIILFDKMVEEIKRRVDTGMRDIPLDDMRRWASTLGAMCKNSQAVMLTALQIERVVAGEPIAVIEHRLDEMTPQQIVDSLSSIAKTMNRATALRAEVSREMDSVSRIAAVDPNAKN